MNTHRIILGDCIKGMKTLPDGCVHTCVTSPPYFGLRDYGNPDQIGLERTPKEYVTKMIEVFREVRRILRDDGTLWLNLGDSYAGYHGNSKVPDDQAPSNKSGYIENMRSSTVGMSGLKQKDLIGIPWRVAFALQEDGWYLRQDIIWHKPNPMPESVEDRCTKAHEYIFLLTKSPRYYYDHEVIKEPVASSTIDRLNQKNLENQVGSSRVPGKTNGNMKAVGGTEKRNKRSVWTVNTKPFKGAHFATFPKDLIEPCVLAGCPVGGVVFDPFTGSGTTAVVALNNQRNFVGTELNPDYVEIAETRIKDEVVSTLEGILE